ncbi:MAG TPA: hypothetical protein VJ888_08110 [Mobilitalea sp.]|nr:hypothetical protein [Mobilitalea sp.]
MRFMKAKIKLSIAQTTRSIFADIASEDSSLEVSRVINNKTIVRQNKKTTNIPRL